MATHKGSRLGNILTWVVIIIAVCWAAFPFYWAIITSFKTPSVILSKPSLIPFLQFTPTLANWKAEFTNRLPEIARALRNSLILSVGATTIAVFLGTLAGYGLARFQYRRWKNSSMATWFLSQRFLPPVVTIIPFFLVMQALKLTDSLLALILANATFTLPFTVLIMRDVFKDLPIEMEESAYVDGASHWQAFWHIALPLSAPAIAAADLLTACIDGVSDTAKAARLRAASADVRDEQGALALGEVAVGVVQIGGGGQAGAVVAHGRRPPSVTFGHLGIASCTPSYKPPVGRSGPSSSLPSSP